MGQLQFQLTIMKWLVLISLVSLVKSEDYSCPSGKSTKTITVKDGDSFSFNSNPDDADNYENKEKCTVKYKRGGSCKELKFECQSFNLQKGDKLIIGKNKYFLDEDVSETTTKKVMKVRFISNKKKTGSGAQCTIECSDPEAPGVTETPSTTEVIMITGGWGKIRENTGGALRRVELMFSNGSHVCDLESLPVKTGGHSQMELLLCGGFDNLYTCFDFYNGFWQSHTKILKHRRKNAGSWIRKDKVLLIGGSYSDNTTEAITFDGQHSESTFQPAHRSKSVCVINLDEDNRIVIPGGSIGKKTVTLYDNDYSAHELPLLNEGRDSHGCGSFINNQNKLVLIVAGGLNRGRNPLSSTEMFVGLDAEAWIMGEPLPSPRHGARGVSIGNDFYLTGGKKAPRYLKEILKLNDEGTNWIKIGTMKYGSSYHGVSVVPAETKNYCLKP